VLVALPFIKIKDAIKNILVGSGIFLSVLFAGFLFFSFYMYHTSTIRFLNVDVLDIESSGYLFALLVSYFLPVIFGRENLFSKRKGSLFYYSASLLLIALGIVLPLEDSLVLFFIGLVFMYFLMLSYSFYIGRKIWIISKVMYLGVLVLLLLPHYIHANELVTKIYLISILIFTLLLVAPFFVNLWAFGLIRNLPDILLLPLFTVLFVDGFYQLSRFLESSGIENFYNITAVIGFLSALFSVLASYSAKNFKEFLFFIITSVSGVLVILLGLSRYVGLAYNIVSSF